MRRVVLSEQVRGYVAALAPEPRRTLRAALDGLPDGRGDLLALEENLAGFWRLRVGRHRVIIAYTETAIRCLFAEERRLVYEIFSALLHKGL